MVAAVSASRSADRWSVLDQLTTGVAIANGEFRLAHCNPAFLEATQLTGWRNAPIDILDRGSGELRACIERARKRGAAVVLHAFELATRDPPLRVTVAVTPCDDDTLLELHAAAPPSDAAPNISRSLRGLAHEVKNPLAGLRGAAQLLQRRLVDPEQIKLTQLIVAEADRLRALADRLLVPGSAQLGDINLLEVAERARALVVAEAPPELKFERDYDPSLPPLEADGDRLLQLVLNLLRNAMQAQANTILVRTRVEHGAPLHGQQCTALRLDVMDDGAGVPEALRESLFLPLVSGRDGGTGLGLALAQEIAHEHGGQLTCRSRPGHTVFTLLLPLRGVGTDAR